MSNSNQHTDLFEWADRDNINELENIVRSLTAQIEKHNALYYDRSSQEITDAEYDALKRKLEGKTKELQQLQTSNPVAAEAEVVLNHVGGTVAQDAKKVIHPAKMFSIMNTYNEKELRDFDKRIRSALKMTDTETVEYIVELKIDGNAVTLMYEYGKLKYVATRGDGTTGEIVTENISKSSDILNVLPAPLDVIPKLEIRGEVFLSFADFEKINKSIEDENVKISQKTEAMNEIIRQENNRRHLQGKGENKLKMIKARKEETLAANPRNLASGLLKRLDINWTASDYVVIDVETTARENENEIIELAALRICNNEIVDSFQKLVRPQNQIPPKTISMTGITNEMASEADSINNVLPRFVEFIGASLVIGHNVTCDIRIISENCKRVLRTAFANPVIDTMDMARKAMLPVLNNKLETLTNYFQIKDCSFCRALSNCENIYHIHQKLKIRPEISSIDIAIGYLKMFCYATGDSKAIDGSMPNTQENLLALFKNCGLPVNPVRRICNGISEVWEFANEWETKRRSLLYPTDGLVVKVNNRDIWNTIGYTAKAPNFMMAYKFPPEKVWTRLKAVTWQVGRTGVLTPVAELSPVQLAGTQVKRATLHNYDYIKEKNFKIGDMVQVEKSGEIIPKVLQADLKKRDGTQHEIFIPDVCPVCEEGIVVGYCVNSECKARLAEALIFFASRKAMNIQGIGEEQIGRGVDMGLLKSASDFYTLTDEDWNEIVYDGNDENKKTKEGKAIKNLRSELEKSKSQPLNKLLNALGIPNVGEESARVLTQNFETIDKLGQATVEDIIKIQGFANVTAKGIVGYFGNRENRALIDRLKLAGLKMPNPNYKLSQKNRPLSGKVFVLTGTLPTIKRDEAKEKILAFGGKVSGSVSRQTNFVVAGPDAHTTSKLVDAKKFGIPIIDETQLIKIFDDLEKMDNVNEKE